ncbi:hypothetical protein ACFL5F_06560 [Planctomycetota bacterium]
MKRKESQEERNCVWNDSGNDGRLSIPLGRRKKDTAETDEERVRYVVTEAYCPNQVERT